jgi:hypothetical protein
MSETFEHAQFISCVIALFTQLKEESMLDNTLTDILCEAFVNHIRRKPFHLASFFVQLLSTSPVMFTSFDGKLIHTHTHYPVINCNIMQLIQRKAY